MLVTRTLFSTILGAIMAASSTMATSTLTARDDSNSVALVTMYGSSDCSGDDPQDSRVQGPNAQVSALHLAQHPRGVGTFEWIATEQITFISCYARCIYKATTDADVVFSRSAPPLMVLSSPSKLTDSTFGSIPRCPSLACGFLLGANMIAISSNCSVTAWSGDDCQGTSQPIALNIPSCATAPAVFGSLSVQCL